jgi:hypothetical protein
MRSARGVPAYKTRSGIGKTRGVGLPRDASWWDRSSRSYADWKGSWAQVMVPLGVVVAVIGLGLMLLGR